MEQDVRRMLSFFIQRMEMFLPLIDKNNIISFIHGYEAGINEKRITENITALLSKKYKIDYDTLGWPEQIQKYTFKNSVNWIEAFKQICNKISND